jgi:hypothetical protein
LEVEVEFIFCEGIEVVVMGKILLMLVGADVVVVDEKEFGEGELEVVDEKEFGEGELEVVDEKEFGEGELEVEKMGVAVDVLFIEEN